MGDQAPTFVSNRVPRIGNPALDVGDKNKISDGQLVWSIYGSDLSPTNRLM